MKSPSIRIASLLLCLSLGGAAAALPTVASAADAEPPAEMAMEELASRLSLTADQQERIAPALQERNRKLKALAADRDAGASRRQKLKTAREARAIQQEFVGQVTPVLTKEQKQQWEQMREETRDRLRERARERD